jgi:hypothetical protein
VLPLVAGGALTGGGRRKVEGALTGNFPPFGFFASRLCLLRPFAIFVLLRRAAASSARFRSARTACARHDASIQLLNNRRRQHGAMRPCVSVSRPSVVAISLRTGCNTRCCSQQLVGDILCRPRHMGWHGHLYGSSTRVRKRIRRGSFRWRRAPSDHPWLCQRGRSECLGGQCRTDGEAVAIFQ